MERNLGHRAPLLWLLVPFICGLVAGRVWDGELATGFFVGSAALGLAIGIFGAARDTRLGAFLWATGVFISVAAAGAFFIRHAEALIPEWQHLPPREAVLTLRVERTFPQTEGRDSVSGLARVVEGEGTAAELAGRRVYFSARPSPGAEIRRSGTVRMKGILESIARPASSGGFDSYLANAGVEFRLGRGRMLEEISPPSGFQRFAGWVAKRMESSLSAGLDDHSHLRNVYLAMMLGRKAELAPEQEEVFLKSGTLHLFAISGLNISAMALALHAALLLVRVPRRVAVPIGLLLLWVYVQATGASPSAVRAWTMIAFFLAARELRWPGNAISAIAASAIFVLIIDPFQLFGASFQMSYGVVASLLLFGIPLVDRIDASFQPFPSLPAVTWRWWHHAFATPAGWVLKSGAICFAATLMSMPMAVEVFGYFTPGAFFANLLVVPMAMLVVAAGFCGACTGMIGIPGLPVVFNHAAALVIALMEWLLGAVVLVPGVARTAEFRAEWMGPVLVGALLALLVAGYSGRWRGIIRLWVPPVFLVVALALSILFTDG